MHSTHLILNTNPLQLSEMLRRTTHLRSQEKVEGGEVELAFCRTNNRVADILTEGLVKTKHDLFVRMMGLTDSQIGSVGKLCCLFYQVEGRYCSASIPFVRRSCLCTSSLYISDYIFTFTKCKE